MTPINGWVGPKHITSDIDKYAKTIDNIELEIETDKGHLDGGYIEDNHDINNWLHIYYDPELKMWRYMVPGKVPGKLTNPHRQILGYIKPGHTTPKTFDSLDSLAEFMESIVEEIKNKGWARAISDRSTST